MNLTELRTEKKQILADIKALRERYQKLAKRETEIKRNRKAIGHYCTYNGCFELTSKKTTLSKLGEYYKHCDAHRLQLKLRYQKNI